LPITSEPEKSRQVLLEIKAADLVEPPPASRLVGTLDERDLPGLLSRDDTILQVARKRSPPPAGAGGFQGAGLTPARNATTTPSTREKCKSHCKILDGAHFFSLAVFHGYSPRKLREIQGIIEDHKDEISKAWQRHFGKR
jgi:hypothetical protein